MHDNLKIASEGFDMKNKTLSSDFTIDMARYLDHAQEQMMNDAPIPSSLP